MQMMKKGLFITFEGPDGSGKSTQLRMLAEWLEQQNKQVYLTREPGGTRLAEKIRGLLLDKTDEPVSPEAELLLFGASRAQHVRQVILPFLENGGIVLCDRFLDSTTAYQGYARGLDMTFINQLHQFCVCGRMPDLTFLLDLPLEEGRRRVAQRQGENLDRMEAENSRFHQAVRDGFLTIARQEPARVKVIDARQSVQAIAQTIRQEVENALAD